MNTITAMQPAKHSDAWHISLDGHYALTLDTNTVAEERLAVGKSLDDDTLDRLKSAADDRRLLDAALTFLAPRPRSREEIRRRLRRAKPGKAPGDPVAIERVMARLERMGLIDDEAFAAWWAEQRRGSSVPHGAGAIQSELTRHGVDRDVAKSAATSEDEDALALAAAQKKAPSLMRLDWKTYEQRLTGFLLRRGFSYGVARGAVRATWEDLHGPRPGDDEDDADE